jgi:ATP synthase protein I
MVLLMETPGVNKLNDEIKSMLKKIFIYDIFIAVIFAAIIGMTIRLEYAVIFFLGLAISLGSFYLNAFTSNYAIEDKKKMSKTIIILSFFLRVIAVASIGAILFTYKKYYVIAYIFGYSSHFISILIYGLTIKEE